MIYIEELKRETSLKEQSEISRKLLLSGLQNKYGFSELPEISVGQYGKPYFASQNNIHFNISHCKKAVACIISDNPVGIDVECINPFDKDLALYISSPQEMDCILNHSDPALAFTILWTRKESYYKLTGKGLDDRTSIQNILINNPSSFQTIINHAEGYVITSCHHSLHLHP
ncbi:MAG: 4'-phosphopantetheinyl transferase superfamily protein [Muribaculaceae bacterium]|nr:4'-phosphopantetheinyl transferase superfamily protein [Muribaculaceae bacterium]